MPTDAVRSPKSFRCRRVATRLALACGTALLAGASVAAESTPQAGTGDLLVAPPRVVFEGRASTAEVTLVNRGTQPATYRISFVQLRMDEDGGTKEIQQAEGGELFADALVRFSPRQVVLEPNIGQTVRLQLRKPADLAPGEYRSHLLFRSIPSTEGAEPSVEAPPADKMSIQLIPVYGISIPIIVRHGETSAAVTLGDPEVLTPGGPDATPVLYFRVHRAGSQSVYGNLTVTFTPDGGKPIIVGLANGVGVWAPYPVRRVGVPLRPPAGVVLGRGVLQVSYAKADQRDAVIAETVLRLP